MNYQMINEELRIASCSIADLTLKTNEILDELELMDINELDTFREEWVQELEQRKMPEFIIDFCSYIVDRVIIAKANRLVEN